MPYRRSWPELLWPTELIWRLLPEDRIQGGPCVRGERSSTTRNRTLTYPPLGVAPPLSSPENPPHPPDHHLPDRGPLARGGGADCAVGSGEWAEPPHSPWTLRRRVQKSAIFGPFPWPEDRARKGTFRSSFGPPFWTLSRPWPKVRQIHHSGIAPATKSAAS